MQLGASNYYKLENNGCCLICSESQPGCLCYDCCYKECFHYSKNQWTEKGYCDLVKTLKEEGKKEWREYYTAKEKKEIEYSQKLNAHNKVIESEIDLNKGIVFDCKLKQGLTWTK